MMALTGSTRFRPAAWMFAAIALLLPVGPARAGERAWEPDDAEWIVEKNAAAPAVRWALREKADVLFLAVETRSAPGLAVTLDAAWALDKTARREARAFAGDDAESPVTLFAAVPLAELQNQPGKPENLRFAFALRWSDGPDGPDRERQRFRHDDGRAPHAGLNPEPSAWLPFSWGEYQADIHDRRQGLLIHLDQPMDGFYSIVIESPDGRRLRNLASGQRAEQGRLTVEWDGRDEDGRLVTAGEYRWRSVHHPGIRPNYRMNFANGDIEYPFIAVLSNHAHFVTAAANEDEVFLASPVSEGGYAITRWNADGKWIGGFNLIHGTGLYRTDIAADDDYLYVINDGPSWGQHIDRNPPDWRADIAIHLSRFRLDNGKEENINGRRFVEIYKYEYGPGAANPIVRDNISLAGATLLDGRLYIASRAAEGLLVVDPKTAAIERTIPLPDPSLPTVDGDGLIALSAGQLVRVNPATGSVRRLRLPEAIGTPAGLAVGPDGTVYISSLLTHQVHALMPEGDGLREAAALGLPGGPYAGAFVPERMVRPKGLAVLDGKLWVTEDRTNPKRAVAWDMTTGAVAREVFGNPPYGGSGAGFDTENPERWIAMQAEWTLDPESKTAVVSAIQRPEAAAMGQGGFAAGMRQRYIHRDGRTFVATSGMANVLSERREDGSLADLAAFTSVHHFAYACGWNPPETFLEALRRLDPGFDLARAKREDFSAPHYRQVGVLWVDANGDGEFQTDEFDLAPLNTCTSGAAWGVEWGDDLGLRVPGLRPDGSRDGQPILITLIPDGYLPSGAPRYPALEEVIENAPALESELTKYQLLSESTVDRFGRTLMKTAPDLTAYSPDGRLLWRFPNGWRDVHGSHAAPLPVPGVMQGTLFFLGMAPLDGQGDVTILNGNHGRFFILTSDGLYLDEMFDDCRVAQAVGPSLVGGECFGGMFGRAHDGRYWLATGSNGIRVYEIEGLDQVRRDEGVLTATDAMLLSAERRIQRKASEDVLPREYLLTPLAGNPPADPNDGRWNERPKAEWPTGTGADNFKAQAALQDETLWLRWEVPDPSPWVNHGTDWTLLFKSGDSVDFQFGANPATPADRRNPVPGDLRLLVAPMGEENVVVLYRHRVPNAQQPMTFQSPWRSETVDEVTRLDNARVRVLREDWGYRVVVGVPLAALGFNPKPDAVHRADFGVIMGDRDGTINLRRAYWSNTATGLVSDVPGEIMLSPNLWGTITLKPENGQ